MRVRVTGGASTTTWQNRGIELIGRTNELAAVDALLSAARTGMSSTVVIRGDAGAGKTSILDYASAAADGFAQIRVDGIESEQKLGFAAIHRLLLPVLPALSTLPPPQRRALEMILGQADGDPPNRFLVGLAVLTLLATAAKQRPLLCLVDDAQWIDGESADLLAFVARRLLAERVVIMATVRDPIEGREAFAGLRELRLEGLQAPEARKLLNSVADNPLDPISADRILSETEGNPLALVELGRDLSLKAQAATLLPGEPLPLSRELEIHFLRQVRSLSPLTQQCLLIVAVEPGDPDLVSRAADALGIPADSLGEARAARLLTPADAPTFRHPLIRAAVYGAASGVERRRIHATLAELIDPAEQDRRAWHLAAAAEGPDESTASELVSAAERAQRRGGWAARFAFLARAAELTPPGARQSERLLVAAEAALVAGLPSETEGLVDRAKKTVSDPLRIAQARRLEAALLSFNKPGRAPAILLEAAESLQDLDPEAARDTYIEALQACLVSCQLTFGTTPAAVGTAALAVPHSPSSASSISDSILTGFATRFSVGYRQAAPSLRLVVDELSGSATMPAGLTRWAILGNNAAADLWDAEGYRQMLANLEQSERRRGALDSLRITLGGMGHCLMWAGDFGGADVVHSEATQISVALGEEAANWEALKVELFAWQGQDEETRFVAEILMGEFTESIGGGVAVNLARIALVILNLAQGNYEEALTYALKLMADDPCPHGSQVLPEVVEAAVRSGNDVSAATAIGLLRDRAITSGTAWALGLLARSEALVTADDPEPKYLQAIDLLRQTYVKTDLARTHLLYGEWLRRQKRRGDARDHLRMAFELFDSMGAKAFAERARLELLATGERARRRKESNPWQLTPQERQIASLAAGGDTNQEIAEKLFLSASTVDYHLRKVYRKLSITSRRKLATALDRGPDNALESQGV